MATLNGFKITAMRSWTGHEGIGTSGILHWNGKRLGEFVDYGDGGCVTYRFPTRELEATIAEKLPEIGSLDMLVAKLADMTETEKWLRSGYRKAKQEGRTFVSASDALGNVISCSYGATISPTIAEFSLRQDAYRKGFDHETTVATAWEKTPTLNEGARIEGIGAAEERGQEARAAVAVA